jgi:hypothetical protein
VILHAFTESDARALRLLVKLTANGSLVRPGYFGTEFWAESKSAKHRRPQHFARAAGRLLNRLKKAGMAEWTASGQGQIEDWGWRATAEGKCAVETFLAERL